MPIGNHSDLWDLQKRIFDDTEILCKCHRKKSDSIKVPHPILCGQSSQLDCGEADICSWNIEKEEPECQEAAKSSCSDKHLSKKSFLCNENNKGFPETECWYVENFGGIAEDLKSWPEPEFPLSAKKIEKVSQKI